MITQENIPYTADEIKAMVKTCEKYNQALERARYYHSKDYMLINSAIENIFPELKEKESEDERIRRAIIAYISHDQHCEVSNADMIAWLEKQSEQKLNPYSGTSFEYNGHIWGMCARDNGVEILFDGELKAFLSLEKSFIYPIYPKPDLDNKSDIEAIKENVDNNNKVKPKFREGNYIVPRNITSLKIWKVINIDEDGYYSIQSIANPEDDKVYHVPAFFLERDYRLWTIQDTKDGDVLVNGSNIFIFHFLNDTRLMGYCHVNTDNGRFYDDIGKNECFCLIDAVATPATKEQCNLLFQKMKEAEYEWDAEKKELKKIEPKKLDADKVIAWLVANIVDFEYYVKRFKQDFKY